jgi:hypothetical protein
LSEHEIIFVIEHELSQLEVYCARSDTGARDGLGIRLDVAGLSLSDIVSVLEVFGVESHQMNVHRWTKKADLQPPSGARPTHVAVNETVIQLNDEQFWL